MAMPAKWKWVPYLICVLLEFSADFSRLFGFAAANPTVWNE